MANNIICLLFFITGIFFGVRSSISYIKIYDSVLLPYYKIIISIYIISLNCFLFTFLGITAGAFVKVFKLFPIFGTKSKTKQPGKIPLFLTVFTLIFLSLSITLVNQNIDSRFFQDSKLTDPKDTKILLIGLDGATWKLIVPFIKKGELPVLHKLINQSYWGTLLSAERATSPLVWTSIATGKIAEKHGIFDHTIRELGAYEAIPVKSYHRKVKAVWNILSENKKSIGLIDWYVTFPPEKVKGYIISRLTSDENNKTYPPELQKDIDEITNKIRSQKTEDKLFDIKEELLNDIKKLQTATFYMQEKMPTDFLAAYTHSTDAVQHYFWKYMVPDKFNYQVWTMKKDDVEKFGKVIEEHWIEIDKMVGDLIKNVDDKTTVVIVSDHGAQAQSSPHVAFDPDKILSVMGFLSFKNDSQEIDFSKTKAFSAGIEKLYTVKGICINLKGRESKGIIKPGEEERKIESEIINSLADLKVWESGESIFSQVISGKDMKDKRWKDAKIDIFGYSNDKALKDFYKTHLKIAGKTLPLIDILSIDDTSAEHTDEGIILISGNNVKHKFLFPVLDIKIARFLKKITKIIFGENIPVFIKRSFSILNFEHSNPTTLDITPTILYSMGLPVAKDMDGKVIKDAFNQTLISKLPIKYISTYEDSKGRKPKRLQSTADKEVLKKLKALGYVE